MTRFVGWLVETVCLAAFVLATLALLYFFYFRGML